VPKEEEHDWITLSLTPNFKAVGRRLGKKMSAVKAAVTALSHEVSVHRRSLRMPKAKSFRFSHSFIVLFLISRML
jgi:predicted phage tail protein